MSLQGPFTVLTSSLHGPYKDLTLYVLEN